MFIVPTNTATSPVTSPAATLTKLTMALVAFTEHRDLVLATLGLNAGSHITTHIPKTIWVYKQPFILWAEAWKEVYQIQNLNTQKAYANALVGEKIRLLNVLVKSSEQIFDMLKKNFIHLGLDKKEMKKFRAYFDRFIKMVSFPICFLFSSLPIRTIYQARPARFWIYIG